MSESPEWSISNFDLFIAEWMVLSPKHLQRSGRIQSNKVFKQSHLIYTSLKLPYRTAVP